MSVSRKAAKYAKKDNDSYLRKASVYLNEKFMD